MTDWIWISTDVALKIHQEQLAQHGGASGVRDANMLESALARPLNLVAYGEPDAAELAASYAFGIARNYPFVDGNKRTAAVVSGIFLARNGWLLTCDDVELATAFLDLAAGQTNVEQLGAWFRRWTVRSCHSPKPPASSIRLWRTIATFCASSTTDALHPPSRFRASAGGLPLLRKVSRRGLDGGRAG